jgi:hypothetical protein
VSFPPLAPIGPKPGKIAGGSKFEETRRLVTGGGQRGVESGLGNPSVESQAGARTQPVQLCGAKALARRLGAETARGQTARSEVPGRRALSGIFYRRDVMARRYKCGGTLPRVCPDRLRRPTPPKPIATPPTWR